MNYSYFFKSNYEKGKYRFESMLLAPEQFNAFISDPAALSAAFGNDTEQTPYFCELVNNLGEEKRTAVANAYAKVFGYENYESALTDESALDWLKRNISAMAFDFSELTMTSLFGSLVGNKPIKNWLGQSINLGTVKNHLNEDCDGIFTIIGVEHDIKDDGKTKALYTLCVQDGTLLKSGSASKLMQMNSPNTNTGGWRDSLLRANLNKFSLSDSRLNSYVTEVRKESHNDRGDVNPSLTNSTLDKFWIPSSYEMFGSAASNSSYPYYAHEGTQYEHLVSSDKVRKNASNSTQSYWLRTPQGGSLYGFRLVTGGGELDSNASTANFGVPLCFCLG